MAQLRTSLFDNFDETFFSINFVQRIQKIGVISRVQCVQNYISLITFNENTFDQLLLEEFSEGRKSLIVQRGIFLVFLNV